MVSSNEKIRKEKKDSEVDRIKVGKVMSMRFSRDLALSFLGATVHAGKVQFVTNDVIKRNARAWTAK